MIRIRSNFCQNSGKFIRIHQKISSEGNLASISKRIVSVAITKFVFQAAPRSPKEALREAGSVMLGVCVVISGACSFASAFYCAYASALVVAFVSAAASVPDSASVSVSASASASVFASASASEASKQGVAGDAPQALSIHRPWAGVL